MVKLVEVCETVSASNSSQRTFALREVYVNPKHVVSLREEPAYSQKLAEGKLPEGLDIRQGFTRITLDRGQTGLDIVVVGQPKVVETKLNADRKELLHG
tara:strand:+ start:1149 stop:1445 length:297 start_codon:yes stop_codon:yes gene_type:complete